MVIVLWTQHLPLTKLRHDTLTKIFDRFASLPSSKLPGMSSSVKNEGPDTFKHQCKFSSSMLLCIILAKMFPSRILFPHLYVSWNVFRGPRCLVFVQLDPDHPGSRPFWNKVYRLQDPERQRRGNDRPPRTTDSGTSYRPTLESLQSLNSRKKHHFPEQPTAIKRATDRSSWKANRNAKG